MFFQNQNATFSSSSSSINSSTSSDPNPSGEPSEGTPVREFNDDEAQVEAPEVPKAPETQEDSSSTTEGYEIRVDPEWEAEQTAMNRDQYEEAYYEEEEIEDEYVEDYHGEIQIVESNQRSVDPPEEYEEEEIIEEEYDEEEVVDYDLSHEDEEARLQREEEEVERALANAEAEEQRRMQEEEAAAVAALAAAALEEADEAEREAAAAVARAREKKIAALRASKMAQKKLFEQRSSFNEGDSDQQSSLSGLGAAAALGATAATTGAAITLTPDSEATITQAVNYAEYSTDTLNQQTVGVLEPEAEAVEPPILYHAEPSPEAPDPNAARTLDPKSEVSEIYTKIVVEPEREALEPHGVSAEEPLTEAVSQPDGLDPVHYDQDYHENDSIIETEKQGTGPEAEDVLDSNQESLQDTDVVESDLAKKEESYDDKGPFYDERWGEYYYDDRGEPYYVDDKGRIKFFYDETSSVEEDPEDVMAIADNADDDTSFNRSVHFNEHDNDIIVDVDCDQDLEASKEEEELGHEPKHPENGRRFFFCEILFCVTFVVLLIALPIVLIDRGINEAPSVVPTAAPTTAPSKTPPIPTDPSIPTSSPQPTNVPTTIVRSFQLVSGPFQITNADSLSVSPRVMAVGAPGFLPGAIQTFLKNTVGVFVQLNTVFPPEGVIGPQANQGTGFGASIASENVIGQDSLLVGAPNVINSDFGSIAFGAAFYYVRVGSQWRQIGGQINPPSFSASEASGRFGSEVASAGNSRRIVVGAPDTNDVTQGLARSGAVYVYDFVNNSWLFRSKFYGIFANGRAGSSVDISTDGRYVIMGAPETSTGYILLYQDTGTSWSNILLAGGSNSGDQFGASVTFLTSDGNMVAIGAPGGRSGAGYVRVYERVTDGSYLPMGPDIVGDSATSTIGRRGTIAGGGGKLYTGTSDGFVREYSNDGSEWYLVREVDAGSVIVTLDVDSSGIGVGAQIEGDSVVVYE